MGISILKNLRPRPDPARALQNYGRLASRFDSTCGRIEALRLRAIGELALRPGETVFDIACGTGPALPVLARCVGPTGRVIGVELSPEMAGLARARVHAAGLHGRVEVLESSVEELHASCVADAMLLSYTHDVLQSPMALDRLVATARPGTRLALLGMKTLPWLWGWPANVFNLYRARHYLTTFRNLGRPWAQLEARGAALRVVDTAALWGSAYIAIGVVQGAPDAHERPTWPISSTPCSADSRKASPWLYRKDALSVVSLPSCARSTGAPRLRCEDDMRHSHSRRLVLTLALIASLAAAIASLPAKAQGGAESRILTLKQAFDWAWQRQPEARSADARRQAADAQLVFAQRWTAEPIALELSAKTDHLTGNHGVREYVAGIAAPLWLPGERSGVQAVVQAERGTIDSRVGAAQWRVAGAVREAWWAAQRAALEATLAQARLANAQQLADDVARHVKVGDLARADQLQADGVVAAAQSALLEAQSAQAQSWQALQALMGAEPAKALSTAAEPSTGVSPRPVADHPSLSELAARADLARRTRELASVQTRANPELALSATRDRGAFGDAYGQSLTVGVRIPFGSDDRQRSRLAAASAEQTEAEVQLELERSRIATDVAATDVRVGAARLIVEAADKRAALAFETRRIFEKSFRLGETDLHTRLRVELEAFEAERQRERSHIDLAQAVSQWRQALGLLPE